MGNVPNFVQSDYIPTAVLEIMVWLPLEPYFWSKHCNITSRWKSWR